MEQNDKLVLVYTTFPNVEEAEAAGAALVTARLAACVNIIPGMTAVYEWEGQLHRDREVVMIVKTCEALSADVMTAIKATHSYDNPALLVLPVQSGSQDYVSWLLAQTNAPKRTDAARS